MDFKFNAHVLISEQNRHPWCHTCQHEKLRIQSSIYYITILCCTQEEDFPIHGHFSNIPLWKSVVWVFQYFCKWPKAPFSSAFRLSTTPANELKNGSCILSGSISALSEGKWTKGYKWPASLKCIYATWLWHNHKKMPVVEGTLSLPLHTSMHRHENGHLIIYILWRNDFTLGVIAQYMIYHDQCVMVSLWKFTLSLACTELTHVWKAELFPSLPFFFFFWSQNRPNKDSNSNAGRANRAWGQSVFRNSRDYGTHIL